MRAALLLGLMLAWAPLPAAAQAPTPPALALTLGGRVGQPGLLDLAALQALPQATVEVSYVTEKGAQKASFTGALLWTLLTQATLIDENGPRTRLQHTVLATGRDGYAVALAIGELNPEFEGKPVLVAYAQDGAALPALRLVVPGDKRAGRAVRDLVSIEVR